MYYPEPILAILCISSFLALIAIDVFSTNNKNTRASIKEALIAIIGAGAVWLILSTTLSTPSPIDVVTSCSMSPILERGDLIFLQGQSTYEAPVYYYNSTMPNVRGNRTLCNITKRDSPGNYTPHLSQCTTQILIANLSNNSIITSYNLSRSDVAKNDIIVYEPSVSSIGLIIHRVALKLVDQNTSRVLYLTKGDNNQITDQEAGIEVVRPEEIHGRLIFRIPLVGYFKLFLFGQFTEPPGCDSRAP